MILKTIYRWKEWVEGLNYPGISTSGYWEEKSKYAAYKDGKIGVGESISEAINNCLSLI